MKVNLLEDTYLSHVLMNSIGEAYAGQLDSKEFKIINEAYQNSTDKKVDVKFIIAGQEVPITPIFDSWIKQIQEDINTQASARALAILETAGLDPIRKTIEDLEKQIKKVAHTYKEKLVAIGAVFPEED